MARKGARRASRGDGRLGVVVIGVCAAIVGGLLYATQTRLVAFGARPGSEDDGLRHVVIVERGASPDDVGRALVDAGVVSDGAAFVRWLVRIKRAQATVKAGTYALSPDMSPEDILRELQRGSQPELRVVVPEGLSVDEIRDVIAAAGFAFDEGALDAALRDPGLASACGVPNDVVSAGIGPEGYLFPDTYTFPPATAPRRVLRRMCGRRDEVLAARPDLDERRRSLGLTWHETLTLASLIEEETGVARERPRVSAVFHNRLKKGMRLQTDPTVLYGQRRDGPITRADLQRDHAFNTYTRDGLPPGPIASPGLASIEAAVSPAKDGALFFVASGDGGHVFCTTLACHTDAVAAWRARGP